MLRIKRENLLQTTKKTGAHLLIRFMLYLILCGLSFVFLYPFIFMLVTSFKSYDDIMNVTIKWIPREFSPGNWKIAFETLNVKTTFFNSLFVCSFCVLGHLLSCSFVAYGFTRFEFKGRGALFLVVVFSIIVPVQTISVPLYMLYSRLNWVDSYLPLIVPTFLGMGLQGGLIIFIFRQFYVRLPKSLEEAAYIDGCNEYTTFFRIILPTASPTILVSFVLSMVWHWNDYFEPGIYISQEKRFLMPQLLPSMYSFFENLMKATSQQDLELATRYHEGVVIAGTAICILPLLIMYISVQHKFMESIGRTGIVE